MKPDLIRLSSSWALCVGVFSWLAAGAENQAFPPHTFTLPDGYELELAAAPGLVERPMHMYFDDEGALYVTDSSGDSRPAPLQLAEPSHRILRLVDKDGDGVLSQDEICRALETDADFAQLTGAPSTLSPLAAVTVASHISEAQEGGLKKGVGGHGFEDRVG